MTKAFGTEFILVNDVIQLMEPREIFKGGPWLHLATVRRGLKEYVAFQDSSSQNIYLEQFDAKDPYPFKYIESDSEWNDLYNFLLEAQVLSVATNQEIKLGQNIANLKFHD